VSSQKHSRGAKHLPFPQTHAFDCGTRTRTALVRAARAGACRFVAPARYFTRGAAPRRAASKERASSLRAPRTTRFLCPLGVMGLSESTLLLVVCFNAAALLTLAVVAIVYLRRLVHTTGARLRALEEAVAARKELKGRLEQLKGEKDRLNHERAHLAHALGGVREEDTKSPEGSDPERGRLGDMQDAALTEWAQARATSASRDNSCHNGGVWHTMQAGAGAGSKRSGTARPPVMTSPKQPHQRACAPVAAPLFTLGGHGGGTRDVSGPGPGPGPDDVPDDPLGRSLDGRATAPSMVSFASLASSTDGAFARTTVRDAASVDITRAPAPRETTQSLKASSVEELGPTDGWLPHVRAAARDERERDGGVGAWRSFLFGSRAASMV